MGIISMKKKIIKRLKTIPGIIMAVTLAGIITTGSIYADAKPASVDTDGKYNAALGLRTDTDKNIYRMGYYHKKSTGTKKWKHLAIGDYSSPDYKEVAGTFTDVEIKGNGKYTVYLENADFMGETSFSKMQVSTDIPNTGKITFSDMVVKINGSEVARFDNPVIDQHEDTKGNCCLMVINKVRESFSGLDANCVPSGTENKISISFKVNGFSYKKGETPKPADTPKPEPADTPEPKATKTPKPEVSNSVEPDTDLQRPVVDEEIRPVVIISIIVVAVIAVIGITFSVTKRKK